VVTPNLIEVLLHCYVSPEPHPRIHAPAVREALDWLHDRDLVYAKSDRYATTVRGEAWIEMLLATPLPSMAWIDASGAVIRVIKELD
jgi:hypothetical protein